MAEITGDGMIVIDDVNVAAVFYWLTVSSGAGPLVAEGSISGSEEVMRQVKKAKYPKLKLTDGPTVILRCQGGSNGSRWVKAFRL
jgi:hypothetical protein